MKKQIQKVMAVFTIASVLVMGFLATFLSFSALQVSKYNFELAEPIKAMSSEYTQYAVAEDGTMLKRVLFEGGIADFIVKFSGNIASFIAIDASQVQNMLAFNALDFGAFAASVPETGKKIFYSIIAFVSILLLFNCTWTDKIALKRKSMLFALAKARDYRNIFGEFLKEPLML
jgi:hypothetical protein